MAFSDTAQFAADFDGTRGALERLTSGDVVGARSRTRYRVCSRSCASEREELVLGKEKGEERVWYMFSILLL